MPDGYYPFPIEYIMDNYEIEKSTYKILKSIDFIRKEALLNLLKNNMKLSKGSMEKIDYLEIKHEFIQKFRIESQIKNLPGLPNVSYSLDTITLVCIGKEQEDFSFFVKVEENSLLKEAIEKMEKTIENGENITYLGGKASSGLNTFKVYDIENIENSNKTSKSKTYINLGMLLPEFNKIDTENSFINIHVSDRKPYDIENNVEKVICFIRPGSIISKNNEVKDEFELAKSIHNKYNLLYKNAIIFGNSYLEKWRYNVELKFRTVSSVILSGRNHSALYEGIDYKKTCFDKFSIIYPFFSYENRIGKTNEDFKKANSYYIPASSLKGSLLAKKNVENLFRRSIIFSDVLIDKEQVVLKNLMKFQYLYQNSEDTTKVNKIPKYGEFFPAIGIEMLKSDTNISVNILIKKSDLKNQLKESLNETFIVTKEKLMRYSKEIDTRIEYINNLKIKQTDVKGVLEILNKIKSSIDDLLKSDRNYIYLGGYKGILGCLKEVKDNENIRNGFYVDEEKCYHMDLLKLENNFEI
ncbi:hypothetical protein [Peptoniphilus indolicus]|nr:hypothetical protein [Peptoniphilus indolicus]